MSRLVIISDIHSKFHQLKTMPFGDILIVSGDLTTMGYEYEIRNFIEWVKKFNFEYIIVIAGNHDFCFENGGLIVRNMLADANIIYLEDNFTVINDLKIYGTPYSPIFYNWAFMKDENRLKLHWDAIPEDVDVLITHTPPHGILDLTDKNENVGSITLREKYDAKELSPKLHVFGHIHHSRGYYETENTLFINAAMLSERYILVNKPFIVDFDENKNIQLVDN